MKTTKISIGIALIFLAGTFLFSACKKKEKEVTPEPDTEQATATDNNLAENIVSDIESMGSQVSENNNLTTFRTTQDNSTSGIEILEAASCATITGAGTQTVIVDFGTSGCVGQDGRTRTGQLIYTLGTTTASPHYRSPGFSMSVSSSNYVVDGNQVNIINKTITNTTPNSIPTTPNPGTNLTWAITANVNIIKASNGGNISWTCNRTKELINTNDPTCYKGQGQAIDWTKAQIKINGTTTGTNAKGESFTATASNLIKYFTCTPNPARPHRHPFISGTITYTPGSRPTRVIDYGSVNDCDLSATLTVNGQTYVIALP